MGGLREGEDAGRLLGIAVWRKSLRFWPKKGEIIRCQTGAGTRGLSTFPFTGDIPGSRGMTVFLWENNRPEVPSTRNGIGDLKAKLFRIDKKTVRFSFLTMKEKLRPRQ